MDFFSPLKGKYSVKIYTTMKSTFVVIKFGEKKRKEIKFYISTTGSNLLDNLQF